MIQILEIFWWNVCSSFAERTIEFPVRLEGIYEGAHERFTSVATDWPFHASIDNGRTEFIFFQSGKWRDNEAQWQARLFQHFWQFWNAVDGKIKVIDK